MQRRATNHARVSADAASSEVTATKERDTGNSTSSYGEPHILERSQFPDLLRALDVAGYTVLGPVRRDEAIVLDVVEKVEDLPIGWVDRQEAGTYRLERTTRPALFDYVVGPHSPKQVFFPPKTKLFSANRTAKGFEIQSEDEAESSERPFALLGVRPCEVQAIAIQDRILRDGPYVDPLYKRRRDSALIIAVQCGRAAGTCFCASMGTGPRAECGFDLALTEVCDASVHYFLLETGTERGAKITASLGLRPATTEEVASARSLSARAAEQMGRSLDTSGLAEVLADNPEHSHWGEIAKRCLSCANCTLVCPTCFCHTIDEVTDLTGEHAERWRSWDSCFGQAYSYIHGGSVRPSVRSRYRQWMTHKLSTWHQQFGTSGCVGCGRCITWCPVGIDITAEARALRKSSASGGRTSHGKGH